MNLIALKVFVCSIVLGSCDYRVSHPVIVFSDATKAREWVERMRREIMILTGMKFAVDGMVRAWEDSHGDEMASISWEDSQAEETRLAHFSGYHDAVTRFVKECNLKTHNGVPYEWIEVCEAHFTMNEAEVG